ncbi:MAG: hypothetical protein HKN76_11420, partial [Saprospiraceae bacterium]|nr:hypothetical protein [Saprospiraceae bacterium]
MAALLLLVAGYTHYSFYKRSSVDVAKTKFETYLNQTQAEVDAIASNVDFLESLLTLYDNPNTEQLVIANALNLAAKPYTIFIYDESNKIVFWSNDNATQPDLDVFD